MNMALTLETFGGSSEDEEPSFVVAEPATMPTEVEEEQEQTESTEPVYEDNVMDDLDFGVLSFNEKSKPIAAIHDYVNSLTPTKQNAYTGIFEGKNLILITAEAFCGEVIDPQRTPTLYRMANEGIRFEEYYQPLWGASTTSGEFSNVVGLVPTTGGSCMQEARQQDLFLTMD